MRFGAGTLSLQLTGLFIFLGFLWLPLHSQTIKILERFEDYDLISYNLEIQISSEASRIAGTQEIKLRPLRPTRTIWLDMGPELKVASITWEGKKLGYDYLGEVLRVDFPEMLRPDKYVDFSIVYAGNLRGTSPYPVWQKNEFDRLQIGLDASHLPAYFWWPCKEHGEDAADSMRLSIILPEELSHYTSGEALSSEWLPGNFNRTTYKLEGPFLPEQLSLYIGNFESIRDEHSSNGKKFPMLFYIQPDKKTEAFSHLAQVKRIFSTMEKYFGEYPRIKNGYTWFQPLDISASKYLFKNNSWGYDPILVQDIAHQYSTFVPPVSDTLGQLIHDAFPTYVEYLMVESWYDKASAGRFLEQGLDPNFRMLGIFEALRKQAPSDELWFGQLIDFLQQNKNALGSEEFVRKNLNSSAAGWLKQLGALKSKAVFQYHISGSRRKLKFYYRWKGVSPGFSYPVYLKAGEERQKLIPTEQWQELTFKGVGAKNLVPEQAQIWYEVRKEEYLKD